MNYYSHHIGDFDRATRHLTRLERSIYRDLLDVYYDTEEPLTLDLAALCRKIIARGNEEVTAVEQTLNEFFTKTPTGWYHERCEEELEAYRSSTSQKSVAGKASAAKRALKRQQAMNGIPTTVATSVEQPSNGTPTNQEPITNNHKPEDKDKGAAAPDGSAGQGDAAGEKPAKAAAIGLPDWMPLDAWAGYLEMRKKQKKPPTARAVELLIGVLGKMRDAGHDVALSLDTSTKNCWTDVYVPRGEDRRGSTSVTSGMMRPNGTDHTSSDEAMKQSMAKHNVKVDGNLDF
jgi:uncharacterized protein YdaU (DUF1376 family)